MSPCKDQPSAFSSQQSWLPPDQEPLASSRSFTSPPPSSPTSLLTLMKRWFRLPGNRHPSIPSWTTTTTTNTIPSGPIQPPTTNASCKHIASHRMTTVVPPRLHTGTSNAYDKLARTHPRISPSPRTRKPSMIQSPWSRKMTPKPGNPPRAPIPYQPARLCRQERSLHTR